MANSPAVDCCSVCSAWRVSQDDAGSGHCKAHPPAIILGLHYGQPGSGVPAAEYIFPITDADDWCREFAKMPPHIGTLPALPPATKPAPPRKNPGIMTT